MAGTSATLLARKWESALLVNVDNDTLRRILDKVVVQVGEINVVVKLEPSTGPAKALEADDEIVL